MINFAHAPNTQYPLGAVLCIKFYFVWLLISHAVQNMYNTMHIHSLYVTMHMYVSKHWSSFS